MPILLCLCALLLSGCYSFTATTLPDHIRTVAIPAVENLTTDANLGVRLREGLVQMFRRNASSVRIVEEDGDAELLVTLNGYTNLPENFTSNSQVETYKATITLSVQFRDLRKDAILFESRSLRAEGVYDISKNESEERHGQERAIEKMQDLLVSNALAKW